MNAPLNSGGKTLALGNTTSLTSGIYSVFGNQAGMTTANSFEAMINSANYFLLEELNQFGLGVIMPTKSGIFGISINPSSTSFDFSRTGKPILRAMLTAARDIAMTKTVAISGDIPFILSRCTING